jgi:hypothetical protein
MITPVRTAYFRPPKSRWSKENSFVPLLGILILRLDRETAPGTLAVSFSMTPPGQTEFCPIANGTLHQGQQLTDPLSTSSGPAKAMNAASLGEPLADARSRGPDYRPKAGRRLARLARLARQKAAQLQKLVDRLGGVLN